MSENNYKQTIQFIFFKKNKKYSLLKKKKKKRIKLQNYKIQRPKQKKSNLYNNSAAASKGSSKL
jgi:hypothetical protein